MRPEEVASGRGHRRPHPSMGSLKANRRSSQSPKTGQGVAFLLQRVPFLSLPLGHGKVT